MTKYRKVADCVELDDLHYFTIEELRKRLTSIAKRHGKDATLHFDAGYNNISVSVVEISK